MLALNLLLYYLKSIIQGFLLITVIYFKLAFKIISGKKEVFTVKDVV